MSSQDFENMVFDTASYPKKRKRARRSIDLGRLSDLITRGLPAYCDEDGVLDVKTKLAPTLGCSYQAVYNMFKRNSLARRRVHQLVHLSEQTPAELRPDGFEPLTRDDFWEFLGR